VLLLLLLAACLPPRSLPTGCPSYWRPAAGKYVTGDINEAYLRNLEEQGRGKRKGARPGRKTASLVSRGQPAEASSSNGSGQAGKQPAPAA
jgi:hypothetical protein